MSRGETTLGCKSTFHTPNSALRYEHQVAAHDELLVMQWFRARAKGSALLAIFALTVQIALSFGHVHLGEFKHARGGIAAAGASSVPSDPPQQPVNDADGYCAICATVHLAATSLLPQAPQLPVPFATGPVEHANFTTTTSLSPRRASFQSRAPPLA
jgi:hypothetical protein